MLPLFRSTSVRMKDEDTGPASGFAVGLARIADPAWAHHRVPGPGLPRPPQQPQQEQAVNVTLVPPPDQPRPKPAPAPRLKEDKAEKPPEPKVEKPPEQSVEKTLPPEKQLPKLAPFEILKPVFQFGDKDTGPRKSLDGSSARDNSSASAKDGGSKPFVAAKEAENKSVAPPDSDERPDAAKDAETQATAAKDAEHCTAGDGQTRSRSPRRRQAGRRGCQRRCPTPAR